MIEIKHLSKGYGNQILFENFSYTFSNTGFYLIYGYSGCGKTTFLNMLLRLEAFDGGMIYINGKRLLDYSGEELYEMVAYMAQDSYLIPYLTIDEHFQIYPEIYHQCIEMMHMFQLEHVLHAYPSELSGGEKQRICLLKALAMDKKIIMLDEPTASLDEENKNMVFSLLKEIGKQALIICISHDKDAFKYCDYALDFQNKDQIHTIIDSIQPQQLSQKKLSLQNLYQVLKKKRRRNKKKSLQYILGGIIITFMMLVSFCINPKEKIVNGLKTMYHLNYAVVDVRLNDADKILSMWQQDEAVKDVVYDYRMGGEYRSLEEMQNSTMDNNKLSSTTIFYTLADKENTYLSQCEYMGEYPYKEYEIMLGYQYASKIAINPEDIIGKTIELRTGKGKEEFKVTGVFLPFTDDMIQYMKVSGRDDWDNIGYFTKAYTKQYEQDDRLSFYEKMDQVSRYIVYFSSVNDLQKFEETYNRIEGVKVYASEDFLIEELRGIEKFSFVAIPIAFFSIIVTMLFFIQGLYSKFCMNQKEFAIYAYFGYTKKQIRYAFMKYLLYEQMMIIGYCGFFSFLSMFFINIVNYYTRIYPYIIFSFHYLLLGMLLCYIVVFVFSSWCMLYKFSNMSWFELLKERRDLL